MDSKIEILLKRLDNARLTDLVNKIDEKQRGEMFVLNFLNDNKNLEITPGDITSKYGVTSARTAKILNQLEEKGLIHRNKSNFDGRKYIIKLTSSGEKYIDKKIEKSKEVLIDLIKSIGISEFELFVNIVEKMHSYLSTCNLNL
ncbi:MAG: MarR family transcriptional regulator [Erysipelotrichaceae bacterium]|nr:MarR family transcriptional regulator [Erysipelotrichaceae bacterium]